MEEPVPKVQNNPAMVERPVLEREETAVVGELDWWFAPSTEKVFPHTGDSGVREGKIWAARGEYESVQLVLRAEQVIEGLAVEYVPAGDYPLPAAWVELLEVLYVPTEGTAAWGFPKNKPERRYQEYPDPLLPLGNTLDLEQERIKPVWVRVAVPGDAPAGEYTGVLRFGGHEAPLYLTVWPFALPAVNSIDTAFGLGGEGLARQYGVELWSEEYMELYRLYYEALLEYRINAFHVPFGGGGAGGHITEPRAKPYLQDERVTTVLIPFTGERESLQEAWGYLELLGVTGKAWLLSVDEPKTKAEYEMIARHAAAVQEAAPGFHYGVTFYTGPDWDRSATPMDKLAGKVDLWIVQSDYYFHGRGVEETLRELLKERRQAGELVWLYVALAPREPFCNFMINNSSLQHRLLMWQLYREEAVSGLAYWQATYWRETENPYLDPATVKRHDPHLWGDGMLFYPGIYYGLEQPVASIRLEKIRDGLEDYEYLVLAEQAWGREETLRLVGLVTGGFTSYTEDPRLFEQVRLQLGEKLAQYFDR